MRQTGGPPGKCTARCPQGERRSLPRSEKWMLAAHLLSTPGTNASVRRRRRRSRVWPTPGRPQQTLGPRAPLHAFVSGSSKEGRYDTFFFQRREK